MSRFFRFSLPFVLALFSLCCGSSSSSDGGNTPPPSGDKIALSFPDDDATLRSDDMLLDWDASKEQGEKVWMITIYEKEGEKKTSVLSLKVDVTFYRPQELKDNRTFVWKIEALNDDEDTVATSEERTFKTFPTRMLPFSGTLDRSSSPHELTRFGDYLYFTAHSPGHGREIWKHSGAEGAPKRVTDVVAGGGTASPADLTVLDDVLYFTGYTEAHGRELWKVDEESESQPKYAHLVYDLTFQGDASGNEENAKRQKESSDPTSLTVVGDTLYFAARKREKGDDEALKKKVLWKLNAAGTGFDALLLNEGGDHVGTLPEGLTGFDGGLFLTAVTNDKERRLWRFTSSEASQVKVGTEYLTDISNMVEMDGKLYFRGRTPSKGAELWSISGIDDDPALVKDGVLDTSGSWPSELTCFDERLFYCGMDSERGAELWMSDGTVAGTGFFYDILPGAMGGFPRQLTLSGSYLFFVAQSLDEGLELWRTDGTPGGTQQVRDICEGEEHSNPMELTPFDGGIVFQASDGVSGAELWESKGAFNNTALTKDIFSGAAGSSPAELAAVGNKVFFRANDGLHGTELWESDGSEDGTKMVENINPFVAPDIHNVLRIGSRIVMVATTAEHGTELFSLNSTGGVSLISDINSGHENSDPKHLTVHNGSGYFSAVKTKPQRDLWVTDGTVSGTQMIRVVGAVGAEVEEDGETVRKESGPFCFTSFDGKLYFLARSKKDAQDKRSWQLWESDETDNGTKPIEDKVFALPVDAEDQAMASTGEALYFAGETSLWRWESGADAPAKVGATTFTHPKNFFVVGEALLFSALSNGKRMLMLAKATGGFVPFGVFDPEGFYKTGDRVFFSAKAEGASSASLFCLNVTQAEISPTEVKNSLGQALVSPTDLGGADGVLWCLAGSGEKSIWKVEAEAFVAKSPQALGYEGEFGASPQHLVVLEGAVYYTATKEGVNLFTLFSGKAGRVLSFASSPLKNVSNLTVIDETLYFVADNPNGSSGDQAMWLTSPPRY
ncbi:MAG: hypothetical protein MI742_08405 [Desulfobacterales bacterium]|nr:hypothetical protein [Desulfobacterales bacterium]